MKKGIYISLMVMSFAGLMNSCDLDAPTKSSMDESIIFSTPVLAEGAVMGIHQSFGETNSYRGRYLPFYGINTDIEWYNSSENLTDDRAVLTSYNPSVSSTQMNTDDNAWAKFYEGIERANLCIRGLRTYGNVESNKELAQLLGEALTLRAVIYNDLVKAWGDVPARFEPITTETIYIPKSDRDVIYKQIIADLAEAEDLVAWPNETAVTSSVERVNKAFVKGLRARICLYAAGYGQRPDGSIRRSTDPDLSVEKLYPIVKQECLDIIGSETCQLGTFEANFRALCEDDITAGKESLWEIPFSDGRGRVLYTLGVKHTNVDKYTQQAAGGANGPLPTMYYDYDKDDVRRDVTCVPYEWTDGKQVLRKVSSWCFGKLRYEWMKRVVTSTNDDGVNWQYMRYADIYLMAAEAINELEGPAAAAPYLKKIRDRAFPNNPEKVTAFMTQVTASKETFFNAIVDERALEFCGEMLRKQDLIRWNELGSKLSEAKQKMTALASRSGAYADLPEKLYYQTAADGESLVVYGLEHGDTDEAGQALGYESNKGWLVSDGKATLEDTKINSLYQKDPDTRQFWPIWQTFLDKSNGMLTNDYGY
ncbi:RagB/SusD family nutrient uptake outer membrane protein [uncultured Bacteroides sp.]|uniref:RagB/SusD family nutrient uptake outer membrane protein n=1 Tax=uncultured Bacteroides sp. TaxID=162156 RepID=UPI002AA64163|nr:RagB/SusD family nutrient uptake outer membrane protein [uncultured Bacteroides sp.]